MQEGIEINKSLSSLGNVLSAVQQSQAQQRALANANGGGAAGDAVGAGAHHIPYSSHTLTKLMQDSIGGTAKTLMFVNLNPDAANAAETRTSLDFAKKARQVKQGT